jgi:excinuclease ABC subunit C
MRSPSEQLQLKLDNLPSSTGVYQFRNASGKIIYIGKAKNLKHRVRSYFQSPQRHDHKTQRLVSQIADVELLETRNEVESLILEANLVHEYKPRYNIALRDDKHFPYIKVTTNEPFPRVLVVRRLDKDGATYFGPYTSAKSMRKTLSLVTRLFKIRTCNLILPPPEGKSYKVCLDYHINRCGGGCEVYQSKEEYGELVDSVLMVLKGKSQELIGRLETKMQQASDDMEYEDAAEFRDQIQALKSMRVRQNVDANEVVDRDIIAVAREDRDAVAVVLQLREGVLIGRQDFQLSADPEDSPEAIIESFVSQYYRHQPNLPEEVFLPFELPEHKLIEQWLKELRAGKCRIVTPKVGEKVRLVELAGRNARLLLEELLIQKRTHAERTSRMVTALQEVLGLSKSPRRAVCFDISNTGETDAVGSCVLFDNAKPKKSEYRHFKIKGVSGQDDFAMMREVVGRYFYRIKEEDGDPPDLVVVDGGKGQLSAALAELHSLGFADQSIIGLAKRLEEIFRPGESDPMTVSKGSPALLLLKRIRDEAHRFAVSYNRKVRSKRTITSVLDDIPGIGPARRRVLLNEFGSVARIRERTAEELAAIKGITPELAQSIVSYLKESKAT